MIAESSSPLTDDKGGTTVFLLGAGCSADYGCPMMQDFMHGVVTNFSEMPSDHALHGDYKLVFDFVEKCRRASFVVNRSWNDLEELFTQAHLQAITGQAGAEISMAAFKRVIWDIYRRPSSIGYGWRNFGAQIAALGMRWLERKFPRPVIITTNYDIHFESQFGCEAINARTGQIVYPGLEPTNQPNTSLRVAVLNESTEGLISPLRVPLEMIKLHGSVNWEEDFAKGSARLIPGFTPSKIKEWEHPAFDFQCDETPYFTSKNPEKSPLIVPPLLGKTTTNEFIKVHLRRAIHALANAREIYIVGYSFPSTDMFMSRLMAEGLAQNRGLRRIFVCNPCTDFSWRRQVSNMFQEEWRRRALKWIPIKFDMFARLMEYQSVGRATSILGSMEYFPLDISDEDLAEQLEK